MNLRHVSKSIGRSNGRSAIHSIGRSVSWSFGQSVARSVSQLMDRTVNQTLGRSFIRSVVQSTLLYVGYFTSRGGMVETDSQYEFVYRTLHHHWTQLRSGGGRDTSDGVLEAMFEDK